MNSLRQTVILALFLALPAAFVIYQKIDAYGFPSLPDRTSQVWDMELYLTFQTFRRPAKIDAYLPIGDSGLTLDEQFFSGAFGLNIERGDDDRNRLAVWSARSPSGEQLLRYRATISPRRASRPPALDALPSIDEDRAPDLGRVSDRARRSWYQSLIDRSSDRRSLAAFVFKDIMARDLRDDLASLLPSRRGLVSRLAIGVEALKDNGIAARLVRGLYLDGPKRRADIRSWIEYRVLGDAERFFPGETPTLLLPIWYGPDEHHRAYGVSDLDIQFSVVPRVRSALEVASEELTVTAYSIFDLTRLPLTVQLVYQVLLTIPVGILMLVFMRQVIGIETLGTFMPVLIGISFRETALVQGIMLFILLVTLGLTLRLYLAKLHLLLVPRLAAVLIFIVICMTLMTVYFGNAGQSLGLSVALFPMVIMTMTIERMSVMWEENSAGDAIKAGIGSLIVASLSYLLMTDPRVEHWMMAFPETLAILLAIALFMGRYTGLRLAEFWRFRSLLLASRPAMTEKKADKAR